MTMTPIFSHCENRKILNAFDYQPVPDGIAGTTKTGNLPNLTFCSHGEGSESEIERSDQIHSRAQTAC
jgi:hypothetical protein